MTAPDPLARLTAEERAELRELSQRLLRLLRRADAVARDEDSAPEIKQPSREMVDRMTRLARKKGWLHK
jgi:hypothetical protein